jgi:hypothetical protein
VRRLIDRRTVRRDTQKIAAISAIDCGDVINAELLNSSLSGNVSWNKSGRSSALSFFAVNSVFVMRRLPVGSRRPGLALIAE